MRGPLEPFQGGRAFFAMHAAEWYRALCQPLQLYILDANEDVEAFLDAAGHHQESSFRHLRLRSSAWLSGQNEGGEYAAWAELFDDGEQVTGALAAHIYDVVHGGDWETFDAQHPPLLSGKLRATDGEGVVTLEGSFTAGYCELLTSVEPAA